MSVRSPPDPSRRGFVRGALSLGALAAGTVAAGAGTGAVFGCRAPPVPQVPRTAGTGAFAGGVYVGDVPFVGEVDRPLGTLTGDGLDARLRLDLATLTPDRLLTPADSFYVRTAPPALPAAWPIRVGGLADAPFDLASADVATAAVDQGEHLLECSGNGHGEDYGLISAARWKGVPLTTVLDRASPRREATRVLVGGLDHAAASKGGSNPGCEWIFTWDDLATSRAFLATHMGDAPLTVAHGAPVRLVVPGWYGCCAVKWVDRVEVVDDGVASTDHMREFASRTWQEGRPALARDFRPARIDVAAVPCRVEEWRVDGAPRYRVVGVSWGGERPAQVLEIRFDKEAPWVRVTSYTPPASASTWTMWWHDWVPASGGVHKILLRVPDVTMPSRHLRHGWYTRSVQV